MIKHVDSASRFIRESFVIIVTTMGLVVASLPPPIILGVALAKSLEGVIGYTGGVVAGVAFAVALESAGVISAHSAIKFYKKADARFTLSATIVALYIIIGAISIFVFDTNIVIRVAGTVSYLVAPMIYVSSAMISDLRNDEEEERRAETEQQKWDRNKERAEFNLKAELERMKIQNNLQARMHRDKVKYNTTSDTHVSRKEPQRSAINSKNYDAFLRYIETNGEITNKSEAAREIGISRPTLNKYLREYVSR